MSESMPKVWRTEMVMSGSVDVSAAAAVKVAISNNPDFFE